MANEEITLEGIIIRYPIVLEDINYWHTTLIDKDEKNVYCYLDRIIGIRPYSFSDFRNYLKSDKNLKLLKKSYHLQHPILIIGKRYPHLVSNFHIAKVELISNGSGRLSLTSSVNERGALSLIKDSNK